MTILFLFSFPETYFGHIAQFKREINWNAVICNVSDVQVPCIKKWCKVGTQQFITFCSYGREGIKINTGFRTMNMV